MAKRPLKIYTDTGWENVAAAPVDPSAVDNLVSFADIVGGQADSGIPTKADAQYEYLVAGASPYLFGKSGAYLNIAAGKTLAVSESVTLTAGAAGYTLTVPESLTVAGRDVVNLFSAAQKIDANSATAFVVEQDGVKDNVLIVDTTNARVGVNRVPTTPNLEVDGNLASYGTDKYNGVNARTFSNTTNAYFLLQRAGGTEAAPTKSLSGFSLGSFGFRGHDGSAFFTLDSARISAFAEEDGDIGRGARLVIFVTPLGGTATECTRFTSGRSVLIGTTTDGMTAGGSLAIAKDLAHRGTLAGFYNVALATRPSAFTQTYATASKTIAVLTYAAASGGATVDAECRASLAQLAADVLAMKQNDNAIIDDGQILGLLQ